ncbi:MAG: DUF6713 family protein [Bacteroidia bacterium]
MNDLIFYFGITLLLLHEMDAVRQKEWHIIPAWRNLKDETGYIIFLLIHIPLYVPLFLIPCSGENVFVGMDIFLIFHGVFHFLIRNNPNLHFKHWYSWFCIGGAAVVGALHLILLHI